MFVKTDRSIGQTKAGESRLDQVRSDSIDRYVNFR